MQDASEKTLGERIKLVRGDTKQIDFAREIGVAPNTLGTYERDENSPKLDTLKRMAGVRDVPLLWLITGHVLSEVDGDADQKALPDDPRGESLRAQMTDLGDEITLIPRLNMKLSAGGGSILDENNIAEKVPLPTRWLKQLLPHTPFRQVVLAQVEGDSMEPTIQEGTDVLLDLGVIGFADNAIYALRYVDVVVIKRIQRLSNGVKIMSDNPAYDSEIIPAEETDQLQIIGRVKCSMQTL